MANSILIVGAGPTGLVLALWLARAGVAFRLIDKNSGPGQQSRAMAVQARTLEFYAQLGIADAVIQGGIKASHLIMREGGIQRADAWLNDMGEGLSPYPFVLSFPQDDHERLLLAELAKHGIAPERATELIHFTQDAEEVTATIKSNGGTQEEKFAYICGCDGARSMVRQALGKTFPGGTYQQVFYVADVAARGAAASGDVEICTSRQDFCLVFPIRSTGHYRLIGIVPAAHENAAAITFDDVRGNVTRNTGLTIDGVNWFSTYHVHHRVAPHFRVGRAFLLGDAAHLHSPAGGQGMNTGLGDAVNLAWKLADVLQHRAAPQLLDSYEAERHAFARQLVATTDTAFQFMADRGWPGQLWRALLFPAVMPLLLRLHAARRLLFKTVSQIRIHYRESMLSAGRAGSVTGGMRLPWLQAQNNFAPLTAREWQLHIYGSAPGGLKSYAAEKHLPCHTFNFDRAAEKAGFRRGAAYLIRPDGYVALAFAAPDTAALGHFLARFQISLSSPAT